MRNITNLVNKLNMIIYVFAQLLEIGTFVYLAFYFKQI